MYISLSENPSKNYYIHVLEETMALIENSEEKDSPLYSNIFEQLKDIKKNVIEHRLIKDWDGINERYTIGAIAVQFFDDNDEMQNRLCDIFGGAVRFDELKD